MENQYFEEHEHVADLDIIESKHVLELISISEEYVKFIANNEKYDKQTIMNYLQKIFPLMYLKGSLIPEITPANEEADERFVTEEEYQHLYLELKTKFSENCDTGHCDCAGEADKIAEDLCDIYQDLKDFIVLYSKQLLASQECAVRNVRELFVYRWGIHVSQLLVHFHNCIYHIGHEHEEE